MLVAKATQTEFAVYHHPRCFLHCRNVNLAMPTNIYLSVQAYVAMQVELCTCFITKFHAGGDAQQ